MQFVTIQPEFAHWRSAARRLLSAEQPPHQVCWVEASPNAELLPGLLEPSEIEVGGAAEAERAVVPKSFLQTAAAIACHRDAGRWAVLYRLLWRLTHGEPRLMEVIVDDDVHRAVMMEKAVRRDSHKMKAFVRFRKVETEAGERFVAWHRPDHLIVRRVAPFFADRFAPMHWAILTPDASAEWDTQRLTFGPGVPASEAPREDELEEFWRTYYASIFNPARMRLKAMAKEMPKKHWATLPETRIIPDLIHDAPKRVEEMMAKAADDAKRSKKPAADDAAAPACPAGTGSARDFMPERITLPQLREAAAACRGCDLYCHATQTVFGEGPSHAKLMFVGEQPGDQEDLAGKPFVGPSGRLLDEALQEAGIPRDDTYVTNAVKHFKFEPRGKRRIHAKPSAREVKACRPWLESEIQVIKPQMIVCLGATAAQSLLGSAFRVTQHRGEAMKTDWAPWLLATVHPSSLLRIPDATLRESSIRAFVDDMKIVAAKLAE